MKAFVLVALITFIAYGSAHAAPPQPSFYLGFDRNDYPGDQFLDVLRQTFSFAGYWLNNPPEETLNSWAGKRQAIQSAGFGFLVLFNGRLDAELKSVANARNLGRTDAQSAAAAAQREGFPLRTIIFLDQEEGGRMLPEQKAYIYAWVDAIAGSGYRSGIYCSGIAARDDQNVITAADIRQNAHGRDIIYFVTNDQCPPSPGCAFPTRGLAPAQSGVPFADVWQFSQSPKRRDFAAGCPANYRANGNCYPPGIDEMVHIDVDSAVSADPSRGRSQPLK